MEVNPKHSIPTSQMSSTKTETAIILYSVNCKAFQKSYKLNIMNAFIVKCNQILNMNLKFH